MHLHLLLLGVMLERCKSADYSKFGTTDRPSPLSSPHAGVNILDLVRQISSIKLEVDQRPLTDGPPICKQGLEYNNSSGFCVDVDECQRDMHNCSYVALCVNHAGSFECANPDLEKPLPCRPGYRFNWHLKECLEVDECVKKPCARTQVCINGQDSFKCLESTQENCPHGYRFQQGKGCIDINECEEADAHLCEADKERCVNVHGSYMCIPPCRHGFRMMANIWDCADIDECMEEVDTCAHNEECVNTWGGFNCEMPSNMESGARNVHSSQARLNSTA